MSEELKLEAMEERASYEAEIARLREALKGLGCLQKSHQLAAWICYGY